MIELTEKVYRMIAYEMTVSLYQSLNSRLFAESVASSSRIQRLINPKEHKVSATGLIVGSPTARATTLGFTGLSALIT